MREYNLQNLGIQLNFIYKEENINSDISTPETNKIKKIELETLIQFYKKYPKGANFESLLKTWNNLVPDEYASLKEELNFIHFDEEIIFKVKNTNGGYQLQV